MHLYKTQYEWSIDREPLFSSYSSKLHKTGGVTPVKGHCNCQFDKGLQHFYNKSLKNIYINLFFE